VTATRKKLVIAGALLVSSMLALFLTLLLLRSVPLAIALYGLLVGAAMIFSEPFVGLINYLIFLYIRPQEFIPGFVGFPIMLMISAATAGVTVLVMIVRRTSLGVGRAPQNWLMLWMFVAMVLSQAVRFNVYALEITLDRFIPTTLMFFLIVALSSTQTKVKITIYLLLIMTVFLAVTGIYQFYAGVSLGGQEMYEGRIQSIGIFSDPNDLAMALLLVLPLTMLHMFSGNAFVKAFYFVIFALLSYAVYLTGSRGGTLAYGLLMFLFFSRRWGLAKGLIVGAVMAVVIFAAGPSRMGDISTGEASAAGRIEAWTIALDLFQSYPVFGVGAWQFTEYHFRVVHNSLLQCASELGLFGLFPWIMLFYISIKNLHFISRKCREVGETELGFLADAVNFALVAYLAAAMFLSRTYTEVPYILLALAAAITTVFLRKRPERYVLIERRDFRNNLLIALGSVVFHKVFLIWAW